MFILNISFIIENSIVNQWVEWTFHYVKCHFSASPFVKKYQWLKLIDSPNEGQTICLQLFFDSDDDLLQFQRLHEENFDKNLWTKFPHLFVAYKSTMEELHF